MNYVISKISEVRLLKYDNSNILSSTQIGSVLGFNHFISERKMISIKRKPNQNSANNANITNGVQKSAAVSHGIKYEKKAIDLFIERHKIKNGYYPPYIVSNTECKIGGRGDYIYQDTDDNVKLLEIKCLYSRRINDKIPMNYWLQMQGMLYIFYSNGIPINTAVYCENRFINDKLIEFWECDVSFDLEYFNNSIKPCISIFEYNLKQDIKRKHESTEVSSSKRKKMSEHKFANIDHNQLFNSYLSDPYSFDNKSLNNYLLNDHIVDLIKLQNNNDNLKTSFNVYNDLKLVYQKIIQKKLVNSSKIININDELYPKIKSISINDQQYIPNRFQLLKTYKTIEAIISNKPIILYGQLYNPEFGMFSNYDMLIKKSLISKSLIKPMSGKLGKNDQYIVIKRISKKIPDKIGNSKQWKLYKIELLLSIKILEYLTGDSINIGILIDNCYNVGVVDYNQQQQYNDWIKNGKRWLKKLSKNIDRWSIDNITESKLYPNMKEKHNVSLIQNIKTQIAKKNEELTQLWSIGVNYRNQLIGSKYNIDNITKLYDNINKKEVKTILGSRYDVIKYMIISYKENRICNIEPVGKYLKSISCKNSATIFLDFEFIYINGEVIVYLIGFNLISGKINTVNQLTIDKFDLVSEKKIFNEFNQILSDYNQIICYHWGHVERTIIAKKYPKLVKKLKFVDLCKLFIDNRLTLPGCFSFGLKDVGKYIIAQPNSNTTQSWNENENGNWINKKLSSILKNNSSVNLSTIPEYQDILRYNRIDFTILKQIIEFILSKQ